MKSWRIVVVLLLCMVLTGSMACNPFGDGESEVEQQLVEVIRGDLTVSVSGSGNIVVSNEAELAFGSGGKVEKVYVEEGDEVSEGDILARLDTSALELALIQAQTATAQAKAAMAQAKAARDQAEYDLNYYKKILYASADRVKVAESQLESAESQLESAESQLEAAEQAVAQAQKQLDEATITAPIDGVVASVNAKEGNIIPSPTVSPKTIIHIIDPTSMELNAEVDEIDIPGVRPDQRAIIEVDALPALQFDGKVISIDPISIEEGGVILYKVKIGLNVSEDSDLRVGMSASADIVIDERTNVLLVPDRAIKQDSEGNPIVEVMVNEQIEERTVVTGISDGFETEIVEGLNEGEVVVERRTGS